MSLLKRKMCGGAMEVPDDSYVAEYQYCGTKQTVPNITNEKS